jgi:dUTP pyrophosphatase
MALVYFAHPIDFSDGFDMMTVRSIRSVLAHVEGVAVFDPATAWIVQPPMKGVLQRTNDKILNESDCMVAYLPTGVETKGTIHEIAIAIERGIPVVLLTTDGFATRSAYEVWLKEHEHVHTFHVRDVAVAADMVRYQIGQKRDRRAVAKFDGSPDQLKRAHVGDAGFDLRYNGTEPMVIGAGERAAVPTGVRIEMPETHYALIVGRSSSFSKRDLLVPLSVIDQGFRGELFAVCWNYGQHSQTIEPGERIAQVLPMTLEADLLRWVAAPLSDSARGENGFGSSGR